MTSMFSTTPRKRRPRAVGEVYISSASSVYLCEINPINTEPLTGICEPIYENAEIVPIVPHRNRRNRPFSQPPVSPEHGGFSKCRISLPEIGCVTSRDPVELAGGSNDTPNGPEMETQCISSFIGEITMPIFGTRVLM